MGLLGLLTVVRTLAVRMRHDCREQMVVVDSEVDIAIDDVEAASVLALDAPHSLADTIRVEKPYPLAPKVVGDDD